LAFLREVHSKAFFNLPSDDFVAQETPKYTMARRESSPLLLRRQQAQYVFPIDTQNRSHSPLVPAPLGVTSYFTENFLIENYMITPQVLGSGSFSEVRLGKELDATQSSL